MDEWKRGDSVSMSHVVIRSTKNGPNLVIVEGKVVQAWCRCGGCTPMPFCDGAHKRKRVISRKHDVQNRGGGAQERDTTPEVGPRERGFAKKQGNTHGLA